jgi:hypothetical protein
MYITDFERPEEMQNYRPLDAKSYGPAIKGLRNRQNISPTINIELDWCIEHNRVFEAESIANQYNIIDYIIEKVENPSPQTPREKRQQRLHDDRIRGKFIYNSVRK